MSLRLSNTGNWSYSEQHCPSIINLLSCRTKVFPVRPITALLVSLYITSVAWADVPAEPPVEADAAKSSAPPAAPVDATPAPAAQTPAPSAEPQAPATAPAAEPSAAKSEKPAAVDPIALKKAGYKLVNENGQQLYCREELSTGSHLKKTKTCLTERELDQLMTNTRREIEYMRMRIPPPQGK